MTNEKILEEAAFNVVLNHALNNDINSNLQDKKTFIESLQNRIGKELYQRILKKYQLDDINSYNDVRALLVGVASNATEQDLSGKELKNFLETYDKDIAKMGQEKRQTLARSMDKIALSKKNLITGFFLQVGKMISDMVIKKNDLKDAFSGIQINKAFEEDIKTVATMYYSQKYTTFPDGLSTAMNNMANQQTLASGLYLASDLAYRKLNHGSVIPVLDADGKQRMYRVHNISKDKGLVCTALVPYNISNSQSDQNPLDIKIMFRGTSSIASASVDLETTGAGSKTMDANRLVLLDEVNKLVKELKSKSNNKPVSISVHGHSLGGSYAERFTSELHQAIFFQNKLKVPKTASTQIKNRIELNNKEMLDRDYKALTELHSITTTSANSARLSKKEADIGEDFIRLSEKKQNINHFKVQGDWISQAGMQSLGAGLIKDLNNSNNNINVSLLVKKAGYGGVMKMDPLLGHCDHPFIRVHDKKTKSAIEFEYYNNYSKDVDKKTFMSKLSSGKILPRTLQKIYEKSPIILIEPITTFRKHIETAKSFVTGKAPGAVKTGREIKTIENKIEERKTKKKPK